MSKFFFCEDFFTFFFLKSAKGVSINYVDTFKTASSPSLDLCPHAWNKLAYSVLVGSWHLVANSYYLLTNNMKNVKIITDDVSQFSNF